MAKAMATLNAAATKGVCEMPKLIAAYGEEIYEALRHE